MRLIISLILLLCLLAPSVVVCAVPQEASAVAVRDSRRLRTSRRQKVKTIAVVREAAPEFRSGEVVIPISVSASSIRLGLSQHGVAVIEFPANDPFYAHHPGDEDFVTIDKRSKKPSIDPLVIRPGKGFVVQKGRPKPSTVITVQTSSGLVIPFLIYPVESAAQNANHVVVTYDRDAVVAARQREGLRTNFVPREQLAKLLEEEGLTQAASQSAAERPIEREVAPSVAALPPVTPMQFHPAPRPTQAPVSNMASTEQAQIIPASSFAPSAPVERVSAPALPIPTPIFTATVAAPFTPAGSTPSASNATDAPELERMTRGELERVAVAPQKLHFAKPVHGLSLAVSRSRFVLAGYRIEVVAVRNTLSEPVRLVPGMPEVYVETINNKLPIDSNRLQQRFVAATLSDGMMLAPGATYYFAFAFDEPILGASDFLRVAVAQTNAADAPATADLITAAR